MVKPEQLLTNERIKKLEKIKSLKIDPYPYSYEKSSDIQHIIQKFSKLKQGQKTRANTNIAGRITALRNMGKVCFGDIKDSTGKLQFYAKEEYLKEKYKLIALLDIGDFIGVSGIIFKTHKGELTIQANNITILTKSIKPLPEKFHGLKDTELRYRQRELDLIFNQDVKKVFEDRAKIVNAVREFLIKKGFTEVDIPTLQPIYGGANAKPFKTHINAWNMDLYLSISPELYLKRLIVGGFEKVFTITKCFRNEGVDKTHNPEFTMMECYWAYVDYNKMMELTEDLYLYVAKKLFNTTKIHYSGKTIDLKKPWERLTMIDAIKKYAKIDINKLSDSEIKTLLAGYNLIIKGDYTKGKAIELIFKELVESKLISPVFIIDHPKESTPLCKAKRGNPELIERFEPFINGWEIGNAYSELNDPILQKKLLEQQVKMGRAGYEEYHPIDEDFIKSLEYGMPPTGGLGLGIDRMVMLFTNSPSLRDVILFPTMRRI